MRALTTANGRSEVKKAAVRTLLILYSSAIIYGVEAVTGTILLREQSGL